MLAALKISVDEILFAQGADPVRVRARRPALVEIAQRAVELGERLAEPQVITRDFKVRRFFHQTLELEPEGRLSGSLVARHLAGASQVRLMVATLGAGLDAAIQEHIKDDPPLGLALDAYGSAAVEALGQAVCQQTRLDAAAQGWGASLAISPGMIGWPVAEGQAQIFALLKPDEAVIVLTPGWQMQPQKSISKVMGIGPALSAQGQVCDYCEGRSTCAYSYRGHLLGLEAG